MLQVLGESSLVPAGNGPDAPPDPDNDPQRQEQQQEKVNRAMPEIGQLY